MHVPKPPKKFFDFGKGRSSGQRLKARKESFVDRGEVWYDRTSRGMSALKGRGQNNELWLSERNNIKDIESRLAFPLRRFLDKTFKQDKPFVLVDWGCGIGNAISNLAAKFPKAETYGFSMHSYKEWLGNKNTKFILSRDSRFRRYFKKESVDVIYSHLGFFHLPNSFEHVKVILPCLKKGGILITDIPGDSLKLKSIELDGMKFSIKEKIWEEPSKDFLTPTHRHVVVVRRIG